MAGKRQILTTLSLLSALIIGFAQRGNGFVPLGQTWLGSTVNMHLNVQLNPPPDAGGLTNPWDALAQDALARWNNSATDGFQVPGSSWMFTFDNAAADPCQRFCFFCSGMPVVWNNVVPGTGCGSETNPPGTLGVTYTTFGLGFLNNAAVLFNRNVAWTSANPGFTLSAPINFNSVAIHEFGHVLGLDHEDTTLAVMNSIYHPNPGRLHADDRRGVRSLYPGSGVETDIGPSNWKKPTTGVVAASLVASPTSAVAGDTITMEWTQENFGTTNVGFNIGFTLTMSSFIPFPPPPSIVIARNFGAFQSAGTSSTFSRTLTIPASTAEGTYFLGVCLNDDNLVGERFTNNNCLAHPRTIFIAGLKTLTVLKTGTGSGTVTSSPPGINCGPTCSATFRPGTFVTLSATPAPGSAFTIWSGGSCGGSTSPMCTVVMNVNRTETAVFTALNPVPGINSVSPSSAFAGSQPFTLTVNGGGFVPSSVVGWNGSNRLTTFISSTQLQAAISSFDLTVPGIAQITVANPPPGGGVSNAVAFNVVTPPAPANDDFANATLISSLPFTDQENTFSATTEPTDPPPSCGAGSTGHSVWYSFTPVNDVTILADTFGSNYDTVLSAWNGSPLDGFTEVACNDNAGGTLQSRVRFRATAGTTYFFMISSFTTTNGGALVFHVVDTLSVYVTDTNSNNVSMLDSASNTLFANIPVQNIPVGVAITPDGRFAYVTNAGSNTVSVIDTASNTVVSTVGGMAQPGEVAITPDGAFAYVVNQFSNSLAVIDTASNTVVATVAVGSGALGVAITPDGAFAYVANSGSNTVSVIATLSNTEVATVPVGNFPHGVAITPDGAFAYVTNEVSNNVSVIDTTSNTVVATVTGFFTPFGLAITPNGAFVYVANRFGNSVSVIDTVSNTVVATVAVAANPAAVAITPDGAQAWVTNQFSDSVSVINTATNTVAGTVPAGSRPYGLAIAP